MKTKLYLIALMLAYAGATMAQDVYTSGNYTNEAGYKVAAVYMNGELLYSTSPNATLDHVSSSVLYLDGDVYWVDNCYTSDNDFNYGDVFRNGERWLSNPVGSRSCINVLFTDGQDVYAAGCMDVNGTNSPVVWKNDDPNIYALLDYADGIVSDAEMVEGYIVACGNRFVDGDYRGVVWRDGPSMEVIDFGDDNPQSLAFYNGDVYTLAYHNTLQPTVYCNDQPLYSLTSGNYGFSISVDGGDVYAVITDNIYHGESEVFKNGEVLYAPPMPLLFIEANSEGVYCVGGDAILKDDAILYVQPQDETQFWAVSVDLTCQNTTPRQLPYFDGFENGQTDWTCMTQWDVDQQNGGEASYWHRGGENLGVSPATGNHCARHRYNSTYEQEGRLSLPLIDIPSGGQVTLSFKTYEQYPEEYGSESVWVSRYNINHEPQEVWTQTSPSAEWKTVTIDLSDYQGYVVDIYFEYKGENAHNWYIDDVSIKKSTGVEENVDGGLAVYPNPAVDRIRIDGLEANSEVQIINMLGERVKTVRVSADNEISIAELPSGLYLVRCVEDAQTGKLTVY